MKMYRILFVSSLVVALSACSMFGSDEDSLSEKDLAAQQLNLDREARFGDGSIPMAGDEGPFRDVRFGYDSSTIEDEARQNLEYNAQILRQNPGFKVQLEGHCDERGTADYNLALGAKRAQSVKDFLISLGVERGRLDTISYGEEVPLDPEINEAAFARNRRVHFSAYSANRG